MGNLTTAQVATEIVALINSSPHSPRADQIEAIIANARPQAGLLPFDDPSDLYPRVTAAIDLAAKTEALSIANQDDPDAEAHHIAKERWDELRDLEDQIPDQPQSLAEIFALAEIAFFGADKPVDDETVISYAHHWDCFARPAARLVMAVRQYRELFAKEATNG